MRQAKVYNKDIYAGIIAEYEGGYTFEYDREYLLNESAEAISLTLPLRDAKYQNSVLFPFFDGLIPEGWLLEIAYASWKIDRRDRFSLLLACCRDCIGSVSIIPIDAV